MRRSPWSAFSWRLFCRRPFQTLWCLGWVAFRFTREAGWWLFVQSLSTVMNFAKAPAGEPSPFDIWWCGTRCFKQFGHAAFMAFCQTSPLSTCISQVLTVTLWNCRAQLFRAIGLTTGILNQICHPRPYRRAACARIWWNGLLAAKHLQPKGLPRLNMCHLLWFDLKCIWMRQKLQRDSAGPFQAKDIGRINRHAQNRSPMRTPVLFHACVFPGIGIHPLLFLSVVGSDGCRSFVAFWGNRVMLWNPWTGKVKLSNHLQRRKQSADPNRAGNTRFPGPYARHWALLEKRGLPKRKPSCLKLSRMLVPGRRFAGNGNLADGRPKVKCADDTARCWAHAVHPRFLSFERVDACFRSQGDPHGVAPQGWDFWLSRSKSPRWQTFQVGQ